jgi:hypothetical protein
MVKRRCASRFVVRRASEVEFGCYSAPRYWMDHWPGTLPLRQNPGNALEDLQAAPGGCRRMVATGGDRSLLPHGSALGEHRGGRKNGTPNHRSIRFEPEASPNWIVRECADLRVES